MKETLQDSPKIMTIKPARFGFASFEIKGLAPLVIHRFSAKTKKQMKDKMETGKAASSKKNREAKSTDSLYEESKYISREGWEGFHAGAIRNAMISACRLVGFKMTLAKMSIFVEADGWDKIEPQIPLVRIYGDSSKQEDMAPVETRQPHVSVRGADYKLSAKIKLRWGFEQVTF